MLMAPWVKCAVDRSAALQCRGLHLRGDAIAGDATPHAGTYQAVPACVCTVTALQMTATTPARLQFTKESQCNTQCEV
jgi:hypothetical protein